MINLEKIKTSTEVFKSLYNNYFQGKSMLSLYYALQNFL